MSNRRDFIKQITLAGTGLALSPSHLFGAIKNREIIPLTILHTNDVHSHVHPFPINDPKYPGLGGVERRAAIIQKVRQEQPNVLLLDAGDVFQGTPYFNLYNGEIELKLMSTMGYDACTIGNHDLDNGIMGLKTMLPHANFPFLNSNYSFKNTALQNHIIPHKIFNKQGLKIGVFGIGVELAGLVSKKNYEEIQYLDPIKIANQKAIELKKELNCDLVICLSHLGHKYDTNKVSDLVLAKQSKYIDLIIGGHTHTFLDKPVEVKNKQHKKVLVTQVGWAGIRLGRIDYTIHLKTNSNSTSSMVYNT